MLAVSGATPRLLLDVEAAARFLPIRGVEWDPRNPPPDLNVKDGPDTAVVTVRHWDDARRAYEWLHAGKHEFRSVAVDSVSELQQRYLEAIAGRGALQIQQWGTALREFGGFLRDMRDLTTHPQKPIETVVLTSMTREIDGVYRPSLQGQMQAQLPYLVDVIGWLAVDTNRETGEEIRTLLTRKRPNIVAGERVGGRIPPTIRLPHATGSTSAEIAASNVSIQEIRKLVFPSGPNGSKERAKKV